MLRPSTPAARTADQNGSHYTHQVGIYQLPLKLSALTSRGKPSVWTRIKDDLQNVRDVSSLSDDKLTRAQRWEDQRAALDLSRPLLLRRLKHKKIESNTHKNTRHTQADTHTHTGCMALPNEGSWEAVAVTLAALVCAWLQLGVH